MILRNSGGEEVLRVEANGGCVTERIEAGDYEMVLTHGEHDDGIDPIFLIPAPEEEQVTKRYEFDQKEFRTANGFSYKMHRYIPGGIVKFFESISNVFTRPAIAQTGTGTPSVNIITLVIIRSCVMCDLSGVSLGGLSLSGVVLTGADLIGSIFFCSTWCDGNCRCGPVSNPPHYGCIGCAPVDEVCTGS